MAVVQSNSALVVTPTTFTPALLSNSLVGSTIFLFCANTGGANTFILPGDWLRVVDNTDGTGPGCNLFYLPNAPVGKIFGEFTQSAASNLSYVMWEDDRKLRLDKRGIASSGATSVTTLTCTPASTELGTEVIIACFGIGSAAASETWVAPTSFTKIRDQVTNTSVQTIANYREVASTGVYAATQLATSAGTMKGVIGTFYSTEKIQSNSATIQKFYLHDATATNVGTLPDSNSLDSGTSGWDGSPTYHATDGNQGVNRSMDGTPGISQASSAWNAAANDIWGIWHRRHLSPPLSAQTIAAGNWTIAIAGKVTTNGLADGGPTFTLWAWRPSTGAIVQRIIGSPLAIASGSTVFSTTTETGSVGTLAGSAATLQDGDILVLEWGAIWEQLSASGLPGTVYHDGTVDPVDNTTTTDAASYLQAPAPLIISSLVPYAYDIEIPPGALDLETGVDRLQLEDASGVYLEERDLAPGIDRFLMEDGLGAYITEAAIPLFRAIFQEGGYGGFLLEDGTGILLGDPGLFYALQVESTSDRFLMENGLGVLLSEEPDSIGTIFYALQLEPTVDRYLTEDGAGVLISEEPQSLGGTLFQQALAGVLSFVGTGPQSAIGKGLTASLSFTGSGPARAITKGMTAALSFVGAAVRSISKGLATAGLNFTGTIARRAGKALSAVLGFTGSIPTRVIAKGMIAGLSFTGSQARAMTKTLAAATLSFTGSQSRAVVKALATASLSFTGAVTSSHVFLKALSAALSFTGAMSRKTSKGVSGALSFSGSVSRAVRKAMAASLSFTGSQIRAIKTGLAAGLSFTGTLPRRTSKAFVGASLSFTGSLAHNNVFLKALSAGLSFTGTMSRRTAKGLTATLSYSGSLRRGINTGLSAGLSFTGSFVKSTRRTFTAVLSFTGSFSASKLFLKALTAALSFTGGMAKQTGKALTGTVSFTGSIPSRVIGKRLSAALSFTGSISRAIRTGLTAALSFTGAVSKATAHRLAAVLSFAGSIATGHTIVKALTGALSFSGAIAKRTGKNLGASLSASGALGRAISKGLTAALSWLGSLARSLQALRAPGTVIAVDFLANSVSAIESLTATVASVDRLADSVIATDSLL